MIHWAGHDSHNAVVQAFQKPSSQDQTFLNAELKKGCRHATTGISSLVWSSFRTSNEAGKHCWQ